ncbi:MAG: ABC transporter permease, partial [Thermomicrobium sp.]
MLRYTATRLIRAVLTVWLAVTAVFVGLRLSGDPAQALLGPEASTEAVHALRQAWGLDDPLALQYARYLWQIAHGDFGRSLRERRPATEVVHERIPATLQLGLTALGIATVLGITLGTLAAFQVGRLTDRIIVALAALGQGIPNFVLGLLLILVFAFHLRIVPTGGREQPTSLILPALTLASFSTASLTRYTRSALLEVLRADYVRTAYAKGLPFRRVLLDHIARNSALTLVTVLGLQLAVAIAGAVITETIF